MEKQPNAFFKHVIDHPALQHIKDSTVNTLKMVAPFVARVSQLEEEIALLTTHSTDTVYRLGYDSMTYNYVSPAVSRLLGYTPNEMRHLNFRSLILKTKLISDGIRTVYDYKALEEARKSGNVNKWHADYLIRRKDGKKIWVTDTSYPWLDDTGKVIGSVGTLHDITDRIEAEDKVKEELARLAYTDCLTGLGNRREFFNKIEEELKRIKRSRSEFSVLIIDIDHFKKVNDSHGHLAGDRVLIELSTLINACLRETDLAARIGGEEFAVFLPDTPEKGAYWVAERICTSVANYQFLRDQLAEPLHVTVSIGVASATMYDSYTSTELYKMADTRLYIAKHTGRNQVSVDEIVAVH